MKRRQSSGLEKKAIELSKMNLSCEMQFKFRVDKDRIFFSENASRFKQDTCTWRDEKAFPCYCTESFLKFETSLPDRKYLTRFSVKCLKCYDGGVSAIHLHCAFCDEVLTGKIAGPGGKISDHLVTIRHVYKQALALKDSLESGSALSINLFLVRDYIIKLKEWSEQVRYTKQASVQKAHLDEVIRNFQRNIQRLRLLQESEASLSLPSPLQH